jgi:hypothetical protein
MVKRSLPRAPTGNCFRHIRLDAATSAVAAGRGGNPDNASLTRLANVNSI